MGRAFTEIERQQLKSRIDEVARQLFQKHGWSGVSISQITNQVGIAKGSFYNFYRNKEALYMTFVAEIEAVSQQRIMLEMQNSTDKKRTLQELTTALICEVEENHLLKDLLDPQNLSKISSNMTDEQLNEFLKVDDELLTWLISIGMKLRVDPALAIDLLRGLFFIGQSNFGIRNPAAYREHIVIAIINEVFE